MEENTTTQESELKVVPNEETPVTAEAVGEMKIESQPAPVPAPDAPVPTLKFQVQGKEVEIPQKEMNTLLGLAIVGMNVSGKAYWEEFKKLFTVPEPMLSNINSVFE